MAYKTRLSNIDTYHTVEDYQRTTAATRAAIKNMFPAPFSVRVDIEINCPDLQIEYFEHPKRGAILQHVWLGDIESVRRFMNYHPQTIYQVVDSAYKNVLDWLENEEIKAQSAGTFLLTSIQKKVQIEMCPEPEPVLSISTASNTSLSVVGQTGPTDLYLRKTPRPTLADLGNAARALGLVPGGLAVGGGWSPSEFSTSFICADSGGTTGITPPSSKEESKVPARRTLRPSDLNHPRNRNNKR